MPPVQVRPFERGDRDQVTDLVNAHIAAVVPNVSVSVQHLLSQLEREPGEFIVDPWVVERRTLVAVQRRRVVAAAHLLRYAGGAEVGEAYRDAGEIRWLLFWPPAGHWPDARDGGEALAAACVAQMRAWAVRRSYADGTLPAPGVYGVPEQWPHVREVYAGVGFGGGGREEIVFVAPVDVLPRPERDWVPVRSLGAAGTRISAVDGADALGYIEVDTNLDGASRMSRIGGWADVGNLCVEPAHRRLGVGSWLVGQAAGWLDLGGVTRLLAYAGADEAGYAAFLRRVGFRELTRTVRGLVLDG